MLISQIKRADGSVAVVAREGSEAAIVKGAASVYALASEAIASGRSLAAVIAGGGGRPAAPSGRGAGAVARHPS
jgi:hypothetical protein